MARARDIANIINSGTFITPAQDQYPFRNLIINGAMQVAQRGTSTTGITTTGYYTSDRWESAVSGTWTQTVENDAPNGSGFVKSLKVLVTTSNSSPSAGALARIEQRIEGQNIQSIRKGTSNAQQLTLSFWVKSNVTGTYIAELWDNDNSRQVSAAYSVSSSATWEKKTITFPADTTGAFDNNNGDSLRIRFWLVAGSNFSSGILNTTWNPLISANRAPGQTNLAAATSNYWQITGVQLEVGAVATPFEFKPFAQELAECQRYYEKSFSYSNAPANGANATSFSTGVGRNSFYTINGTAGASTVTWKVSKRANPTLTIYGNSSGHWGYATNNGSLTFASATFNPQEIGENGARITQQVVDNTFILISGHWAANAEL
jgi:hypothetical protein